MKQNILNSGYDKMIKNKIECKDKKEQQIILHLGLHKTASSYLQKNVFPKLEDVEVQHLMEICQIKFTSFKKTLLISSEGLLSSMPQYEDNDTVEDSIEALYRIYPNARIILGIRNDEPWFRSCWNQYIRSGGTMSYIDYLFEYGGTCLLPHEYVALMEKRWKNIFVYHQEDLKLYPKEVIQNMCNFIGVPMPIFDVATINKSFSMDKIIILRFLNHWTFGIYNKVYAKIISW